MEHSAPSCQDDILEQVFSDVVVALDNAVVSVFVDAIELFASNDWVEEKFRALYSFLFQN